MLTGKLRVLSPSAGVVEFGGSIFRCERSTTVGPVGDDLPPREAISGGASIDVLAVPRAGRPAGYVDAVGSFALTAEVDRVQIELGESIELTVVVEERRRDATNIGYGVLLKLAPTGPFRIQGEPERERAPGRQTIRATLVPEEVGEHALPSIELAWFDPESRSFQGDRTSPIPIRVTAPGTASATGDGDPTGDAITWWPRTLAGAAVVVCLMALGRVLLRRRGSHASPVVVADRTERADVPRAPDLAAVGPDLEPMEASRLLARHLAARLEVEPGRCIGPDAAESLRSAGLGDDVIAAVLRYHAAAERAAFAATTRRRLPASELVELAAEIDRALGRRDGARR